MKKMMILAALILLLCNVTFALTSTQQANFKQVQTQLSKQTQLSGNFKQTRDLRLLSKPLVSTGHFTLSKQHGLNWSQSTPFKSTLIVTNNKIVQQLGNNPATILTKEQHPIIFSFSNIFLAVFNGNINQVKQYFNVNFQGDIGQWQITLSPKNAPLNKAINRIILSGNQYIQAIVINDTQNNHTTIDLQNITGS